MSTLQAEVFMEQVFRTERTSTRASTSNKSMCPEELSSKMQCQQCYVGQVFDQELNEEMLRCQNSSPKSEIK
eukprot:4030970-Amphidinium_carterae.2